MTKRDSPDEKIKDVSFFDDEENRSKYNGGSFSRSEKNTEEALKELRNEGVVAQFIRSWRNQQFDRKGVDFTAFFNSGWTISFQVKSRNSDVEDHFKKHPFVKALVVVRPTDTIPQTKNKLLTLFSDMKKGGKDRYVILSSEEDPE